MNLPMSTIRQEYLPDLQAMGDLRKVRITAAGVAGYRFPATIIDVDGTQNATIVSLESGVCVEPGERGAHMSRLIEPFADGSRTLNLGQLADLAQWQLGRSEVNAVAISLSFPWFIAKQAPVSGQGSLLDVVSKYRVTAGQGQESDRLIQNLSLPVTTLCPCSKAISRFGAHNQRATIEVDLELSHQPLAISELVARLEAHASCDIYGLLKRSDEKYVTERAYENPRFVEDLARDVYTELRQSKENGRIRVRVTSHESIHSHDAFALIDDWAINQGDNCL